MPTEYNPRLDYRLRAKQAHERWVRSRYTLPDLERNVWFFLFLMEAEEYEQRNRRAAFPIPRVLTYS